MIHMHSFIFHLRICIFADFANCENLVSVNRLCCAMRNDMQLLLYYYDQLIG